MIFGIQCSLIKKTKAVKNVNNIKNVQFILKNLTP